MYLHDHADDTQRFLLSLSYCLVSTHIPHTLTHTPPSWSCQCGRTSCFDKGHKFPWVSVGLKPWCPEYTASVAVSMWVCVWVSLWRMQRACVVVLYLWGPNVLTSIERGEGSCWLNGDFRTQRLNVCSGCETATVWEYFQSDLRTYDKNLYEKIQI